MIFENIYVTIPILSWLVAQVLKVIIESIKYKKFKFSRILGYGGMPSSHAAIVSSLATLVALNRDVTSFEFGAVFIFTLIIIADAMGVRYESGKHAKAINDIVEDLSGSDIEVEISKLKEQVGHRPIEVLAGLILGTAIAYSVVVLL